MYLALDDKYLGFQFASVAVGRLLSRWGILCSQHASFFPQATQIHWFSALVCRALLPSSRYLHASLLLSRLQRASAPARRGVWKFTSRADEQPWYFQSSLTRHCESREKRPNHMLPAHHAAALRKWVTPFSYTHKKYSSNLAKLLSREKKG